MLNWDVSVEPPETVSEEKSNFATKSYTSDWIGRLPVAAKGKAAFSLKSALKNVTEHRLPYDKRLYFLEQTASLSSSLFEGVVLEIHRQGLPMKPATSELAKQALEILAMKVIGYQQVIEALTASFFAGGFRRKRLLGTAMMRVVELAGQMFDIYRHASISPASGLWALCNRYYSIADSEGFAASKYRNIQGSDKTSIATVYKTQLLLEGINCYDLRHFELAPAYKFIAEMSKHVAIGTKGDPTLSEHFCFRVDEDAPPSRFAPERKRQCETGESRRIVNLIPLIAALNKVLSDQSGDESELAIRHLTARKLMEGWRLTGDGRDIREESERTVDVAFGLSNIVAGLAEIASAAEHGTQLDDGDESIIMGEETIAPVFDAEIDGLDKELHQRQLQEQLDEWSIMPYVAPKAGNAAELKLGEAQYHQARIVNESPGGYGIEIAHGDGSTNFKAGELVAMELDKSGILCAIRWVRQADNGVALGLVRVGERMQPYSLIVRRGDNESQPLPALLLHHRDGDAAIVLHNLNLRSEQVVSFSGAQALSKEEQLDSTPSFVCYRIDDKVYQTLFAEAHAQFEEQKTLAVQQSQQREDEAWEMLTTESDADGSEIDPFADLSALEADFDFDEVMARTRKH